MRDSKLLSREGTDMMLDGFYPGQGDFVDLLRSENLRDKVKL